MMKIEHFVEKKNVDCIRINGREFEAEWFHKLLEDARDGSICIRNREFRKYLEDNKIFKYCGSSTFGGAELGKEAPLIKKYIEQKIWKW